LVVPAAVKAVWSSVMVEFGVQFVMIHGQLPMLKLCADNWDSQQLVCALMLTLFLPLLLRMQELWLFLEQHLVRELAPSGLTMLSVLELKAD
jgi:hypothetical protein